MPMTPEQRAAATARLKRESRKALIAWCESFHLPYFLTLNTNRPTSLNALQQDIACFAARLDRKYLGRRFRQLPEQRCFFAGAIELGGSNPHAHLCFRPPAPMADYTTREKVDGLDAIWRSVVPSGSIWLKLTNAADDQRRIAAYFTKEFRRHDFEDGIVLSTHFHPAAPLRP